MCQDFAQQCCEHWENTGENTTSLVTSFEPMRRRRNLLYQLSRLQTNFNRRQRRHCRVFGVHQMFVTRRVTEVISERPSHVGTNYYKSTSN